ncbi:MAG TPA: NAD-dependent epimerase/dehydratase family protein, partial [Ignavibacteria bacterium]|nr:NAD-dependent epimerase/dehydratase family protein [Ignavibacteria bacterium]
MKGTKVLVTGGAGFLGTNLIERLINERAKIIIVDDLSRRGVEYNLEYLNKKSSKIKHYQVEINDTAAVIVREKPDVIYHFAAQVAVTTSMVSPLDDFRINAEGTFNVARTAGEYNIPVIYTSTNKVYGDNVNRVPIKEMKTRYDFSGKLVKKGIDENFSIDASHHTPYGCSKLAGELYVREYGGVV